MIPLLNPVGHQGLWSVPVSLGEDVVVSFSSPPGELIPGWVEDGTTISFPIASLATHGLTIADADATTGDSRQVLAAFYSRFFEWFNELETPPTALKAVLRHKSIPVAGDYTGMVPKVYETTIYVLHPEGTVAPEAE